MHLGIDPLQVDDYVYGPGGGTLQRGIFASTIEDITRAVNAGVIKTTNNESEISANTTILADDVLSYLGRATWVEFENNNATKTEEISEYLKTKHLMHSRKLAIAIDAWNAVKQICITVPVLNN